MASLKKTVHPRIAKAYIHFDAKYNAATTGPFHFTTTENADGTGAVVGWVGYKVTSSVGTAIGYFYGFEEGHAPMVLVSYTGTNKRYDPIMVYRP